MAGKYGPSSITCTLEDSPGGTARDIHGFLLSGVSAHDISEMMETTGLGDSSKERTPIGILDSPNQTLKGSWDTTATTGSHAVFGTVDDGPTDDGREMVLTLGDSKTWTRDYRLAGYKVIADTGSIQTFEAELVATGAAAWGP